WVTPSVSVAAFARPRHLRPARPAAPRTERPRAPKAISRRVTMMTPQRSIWILRACLHAAIQLARTDGHVQVSNQPREVTCAEGMTISQRTPLGGKESLTLPSSALLTTVSIIALPKPER